MLNGIDPILIFQLYKNLPSTVPTIATIPLTSEVKKRVTIAVVPIYLSEQVTGIFIDSESKNIDIDTDAQSLTSGEPVLINQKTLGSIVTVNLIAKQGSVGLTILLALAEQILDKVTSQEYEITYMHGAITVFAGLIHGFSIDQSSENDLFKIKIELSRGRPKTKSVVVAQDPNAARLGTVGASPPTVTGPLPSGGSSSPASSAIQPGLR